MKIMHKHYAFLIAVFFAVSTLLGQGNSDNYVVSITKSSLRSSADPPSTLLSGAK